MFPRSALNYYSIVIDEPESEHDESEPDVDILTSYQNSEPEYSTSFRDMDVFFSMLYIYFINHGFYPSIFRKIIVLTQYTLLTCIVYFLIWKMDYHKTLISKQFFTYNNSFTFWEFLYIFIASIGWFVYTIYTLNYTRRMLSIKHFCNTILQLDDTRLQNTKWIEFVEIIEKTQLRHKFYKLNPSLSEYQITQHILRFENILLALIQKKLVTTRIQIDKPFLKINWPYIPKLYEYALYYCIIDPVFNHRKHVAIDGQTTNLIQFRLKLISFGILGLSPFILVTLLLYFLFRYFEDFRQNRGTFKSRKWSSYSLWIIRKHNELHHKLLKRMSIAYIYANLYVNSFNHELQTILARFVAFVCSIFIVIPFVLSIIDEDFLYVHVLSHDKTVLWFMGVCGLIYSVSKKYIKDEYQVYLPEKYIQHVIAHTRFDPPEWSDLYHTRPVYKEFCTLFQHKFVYILEEMTSVFIVPWLLLTRVKHDVDYILDFYKIQVQKDTRFNLGYIYVSNTPIVDEITPDSEFIQNILTFSLKSELV